MPWGRYVLGYHGCDATTARKVASGREPLRPSKNVYDWLGHGYYFWEDSPRRALRWAEAEASRRGSLVQTPGVLGAVIEWGNCLNLIDDESIEVIKAGYAEFSKVMRATGALLPRNTGKQFGARKLDCAVFEFVHKLRVAKNRPAFDTVRAFFVEGKPLYPRARIRALDHIQICVREPRQIVGYFLPRVR